MLGQNVPPSELVQARSPSLDLDSLYGGGPGDPESARFYESDELHLKMGKTVAAGGIPAKDGFDLPRRGSGSTAKKRREALIPDPRNDENLAVAQTHLALIRFHNRVVDTLPASVPASERFARARKLVTKHYQWMLRTDYLPRICERRVVNDVFRSGRKAFEAGADPGAIPTMPLEFSVAAFRLGHSMVRGAYNWNRIFDDGAGTLDFLFLFSGLSGDLGGNPRLPSNWIADFRRVYDFGQAGRADLTVPERKFNRAMRIDTMLVNPLGRLPGFPRREASLALRNLIRARMVTLATGQQMTSFLRSRGLKPGKLTNAQIRAGKNGATLDGLTKQQRTALIRNTPLWFYVLREAELNGGKLDGVGGRIVAETFHRAMEGSRASIVRDKAWRPTLGPNNRTFRMVDLLLFAFEGKKNLLAPLG
jgi:Animal haem peroxidase